MSTSSSAHSIVGFIVKHSGITGICNATSFLVTKTIHHCYKFKAKTKLPGRSKLEKLSYFQEILVVLELVCLHTAASGGHGIAPAPSFNAAPGSHGSSSAAIPALSLPMPVYPYLHSAESSGKASKRKLKWEEWNTIELIEVMSAEFIENEERRSTDRCTCERHDAKWTRIQRRMNARGVVGESSQFKNRWESLQTDYKTVNDFIHKSGNDNFFEMGRVQRKAEKLPLTFQKAFHLLMDSFLKECANVTPVCMAESFDSLPGDEEQPVADSQPAEIPPSAGTSSPDTTPAPAATSVAPEVVKNIGVDSPGARHSESASAANSGVRKCKKRASNDSVTNLVSGVTTEVMGVEKDKLEAFKESENQKMVVRERTLIWYDYYLSHSYNEQRWISTIRMPKCLFLQVVAKLTPYVQKADTQFRKAVPTDVKVAVLSSISFGFWCKLF
ncbi:hypothetical protein R1sor_015013 [Riccia sorocarpa]|uniref:Myb/SANT-like DNA-binding domain-containing protein n=1 Tax=Riccia sorocarpa TaxID=122646 RepID=A0ABD3HEX3_9MARC